MSVTLAVPPCLRMAHEPTVVYDSPHVDNRLTLPKHFCERLTWLTGQAVQAWFYVLESGRCRILSDEEVQNDPRLEPLRLLALGEQGAVPPQPSYGKPLEDAASVAQLIPATIDLHRGSWRILLSDDLAALAPPGTNVRTLAVLMPEGYLEIWYADVLRQALRPPWRNRR